MSCAKTAEPIEMPFGLKIRVNPSNHVLDGGSDLPRESGNFKVMDRAACCKIWRLSAVSSLLAPAHPGGPEKGAVKRSQYYPGTACCYRRSMSVGLSVTIVSLAKNG